MDGFGLPQHQRGRLTLDHTLRRQQHHHCQRRAEYKILPRVEHRERRRDLDGRLFVRLQRGVVLPCLVGLIVECLFSC